MVALPLTVLAVLAATGHPRTGEGAVVVGLLLIGWILVLGGIVAYYVLKSRPEAWASWVAFATALNASIWALNR